jgi:hypothetical protein
MTRLLHALRYAIMCGYHGFCSGFAYPDWPVHVVSANVSAAELASLIMQAAHDRCRAQDVDTALYEDVLTETGTGILRREGIE